MIETMHQGWRKYSYNSFGEFMEYVMQRRDFSKWNHSHEYGTWHGTNTWDQAVALALAGWPEGSEKAARVSSIMLDKVTSLVPREEVFYDTTGRDFDIGLVVAGQPECWYDARTIVEPGAGKFLKLVYNTCTSANVSTKIMERKGATIGALVNLLEIVGHHVELWIIDANLGHWGKGPNALHEILIKSADQPLDLDRIMFTLANPAMLRRFMFAAYESHKELWPMWSRGYGLPGTVPKDLQGDIYIDSSCGWDDQWESLETAQKWIVDELAKQGVHIDE